MDTGLLGEEIQEIVGVDVAERDEDLDGVAAVAGLDIEGLFEIGFADKTGIDEHLADALLSQTLNPLEMALGGSTGAVGDTSVPVGRFQPSQSSSWLL